jgi:sugar/nucleoside kinase (ribokinase family)
VYLPGRSVKVGAWPVPADPTGSGDLFSAAYLAARSEGLNPIPAAERATELVRSLLAQRLT